MTDMTSIADALLDLGARRGLRLYAQLGEAVGISSQNIFRGDNGRPLEITAKGARFAERVQSGMTFVDGIELGDPAEAALRDRRELSADGILFVVATVSADDGETLTDHEIVLRGIPLTGDENAFVKAVRKLVVKSLDRASDNDIHEVEL